MADQQSTADEEFVLTRVFDAPRQRVWEAWSEGERLAKWWGPKGFQMRVANCDFRPGGLFHYGMETAGGQTMWGRFVFQEITAPERIVYVSSFSDENAGISRHPMAPEWPAEVLSTLTFEEEDDKTRLTLRGSPLNATEAERAFFAASRDGVRQGFTATLDQLDAYLQGEH
jgi:uncharacterized protein YndB with AHSA1/START domain